MRKNPLRLFLASLPALLAICATGQISREQLRVEGYLEPYFSYGLRDSGDGLQLPFGYNFNRHNEFTLNLGLVRLSVEDSSVRAAVGLMAGTYAEENLAAESPVFRHVYEASAGVRLIRGKSLWLDMGIFPSHIGYESVIGLDNWNLTRSIMADNSPYYESGARISYETPSKRWLLSALVLNGWQRIRRVEGNSIPSFGHQVQYRPTGKITLQSSSFIGTDDPDFIRRMRYFHNFYLQYTPSDEWGFIFGFDAGMQQIRKYSEQFHYWSTASLVIRRTISEKLLLAGRAEYFEDPDEVIITSPAPDFGVWGYSLNADIRLSPKALWRFEFRQLHSRHRFFRDGEDFLSRHAAITTSLAVRL